MRYLAKIPYLSLLTNVLVGLDREFFASMQELQRDPSLAAQDGGKDTK